MARPMRVLQSFDPNRECIVRRSFRANGRLFEKGQPFPWRRMAVSLRRVKQIFEQGKLMHPTHQELEVGNSGAVPISAAQEEAEKPDVPEGEEPKLTAKELEENYSMTELREMAKKRGLPTRRSKSEQIAELIA